MSMKKIDLSNYLIFILEIFSKIIFNINNTYTLNKKCKRNFKNKII